MDQIARLVCFGKFTTKLKSVEHLELNTINHDIMSTFSANRENSKIEYFNVCKMPRPALLSKWYCMEKTRQIPRWSKMHRLLEAKHKELLNAK